LLVSGVFFLSGRRASSEWHQTVMILVAVSGAILTLLGIVIYRMPVIATVTSLVIYTAMLVATFLTEPGAFRGNFWYIQIMIFVALFNAVKAAFAYEKEQKISGSRTF
jgi:hypothetical protein